MNKKAFASAVAVMAATITLPFSAAAADTPKTETMELSASVASDYILTIPSNTSVALEFGKEKTEIGSLKVTGNVKPSESVTVNVEKTAFQSSEGNTFDYRLLSGEQEFQTASWNEEELRAEKAKEIPLTANIPSKTWYSAAAGDYTATITFTAKLNPAPAEGENP